MAERTDGCEGARSSGDVGPPDRYHGEAALRSLLEDGGTVLVRGSWLVELARQRGTLPRRQELQPEATWTLEGLFPGGADGKLRRQRPIEIAVVSHCWLTPEHPDPQGDQVQRLARFVEEYIRSFNSDIALFIDWCSLFQEPRSAAEQACFMRSLCRIDLWYTHQLTWKWMLTSNPEGWQVTQYEARGWPTFEWSVAQLAALPERVLDLGRLEPQACENWSGIVANCALRSRQPPSAPATFAQKLEAKVFAHALDRGLLEATYRRSFEDLIGSAEFLDFSFLGWGDEEFEQLAEALPLCSYLRRLYLSWNRAGDAGVEALAAALPRCNRLRKLGLAGNPISDGGKLRFRDAWSRAGRAEDQLDLW